MREIKFRAWHIETKSMIYLGDYYLIFNDKWDYKINWSARFAKDYYNLPYPEYICQETAFLMQYTGLKCYNGKKWVDVYEGDILQDKRYKHKSAIVYSPSCGWVLQRKYLGYPVIYLGNSGQDGWSEDYRMKNFKLIGNIHENSDLIK